jgi:DNA repair protein RecO (recombination protein O)
MNFKREVCIEAINLRTHKLSGYKLLTVYSKEHGLIKLSGSKLGGRSEPFVHNRFWISIGQSEIHNIRQTEFIAHFTDVSRDLSKMAHAWQYAEFLEACTHENEERSEDIFNLLLGSLSSLEEGSTDLNTVSINFLWNLTKLMGYEPSLKLCGLPDQDCELVNGARDREAWFDFEHGGLLCSACAERPSPDSIDILPKIYAVLNGLEKGVIASASSGANQFVMSILQRYLQKHSKRKIKSTKILQQLMG